MQIFEDVTIRISVTSCETSHIERGKMPATAIWMLVTCTYNLGLYLLLLVDTNKQINLIMGTELIDIIPHI